MQRPRILIIYTGGTIGMIQDAATGALRPFGMAGMLDSVPLLARAGCDLEAVELDPPIDSSDMAPEHWAWIAKQIDEGRGQYDGFVVLHGSDTMAYTASALSFMLEGLDRPVVLTGSQLPMGLLRTDARENLVTSIMVAMAKTDDGQPRVPEVCILFEDVLYRGNRTSKVSSSDFEAFRSPNYRPLARAGVSISYNDSAIERNRFSRAWSPKFEMSNKVMVVRLYPGIDLNWLPALVEREGLGGIVLETFGSGNAPQNGPLLKHIKAITTTGVHVLNVSQCPHGQVDMTKYANGRKLAEAGVISGFDLTVEAALTKLMYCLANVETGLQPSFLTTSQRGESCE